MPNGYEVNGSKLRVYFSYKNKLCRESLNLPDTPENRDYAKSLVATINHEIKAGVFEYSKHFSQSKHLAEKRLGFWLDTWLGIKSKKVAPSTIRSYQQWIRNYIRPKFGAHLVESIDAVIIEQWIAEELSQLSSKSIKDIVSVVRQVYELYRKRNRSSANPTDGVRIDLGDSAEPDAFTISEIELISTTKTTRLSERNAAVFQIWTGCRPSELLALGWDCVDLKSATANFDKALVLGRYKATKTKRSKRSADILPKALEAIEKQFEITGHLDPIEIKVLSRDNRKISTVLHRPVFINTWTGKPYDDAKNYNRSFFSRHLKEAGVRFRGVSICRHTFASLMISTGEFPLEWIWQQMGHTSEAMLWKHYAKLMRDQRRFDPSAIAKSLF